MPVAVVPPRPVDRDLLERILGEPSLHVEHVDSPSILVDGRYHTAASHWLRRKHQRRPVMATTVAHEPPNTPTNCTAKACPACCEPSNGKAPRPGRSHPRGG